MRIFLLTLVLLALAACGSAPVAAPGDVPVPTIVALDAQAQAVVNEMQTRLAAQAGVDVAKLTLVSAQPVRWTNSGLGCVAPDRVYTQVIVDGYLLLFSDGTRSYEVHSGGPGGPAVVCDNGTPQDLEQ